MLRRSLVSFVFFNDTATTEIYTLSLHDALPIYPNPDQTESDPTRISATTGWEDRKSTRLNSSHSQISYAVFCLKKKTKHTTKPRVSHSSTASTPSPSRAYTH